MNEMIDAMSKIDMFVVCRAFGGHPITIATACIVLVVAMTTAAVQSLAPAPRAAQRVGAAVQLATSVANKPADRPRLGSLLRAAA